MHNHQNGVNLLDLLVVLALLALLMGVAFPGYQALQENNAKQLN